MIKTIIFDCYGTLVNTGEGSINAVKQILQTNNSSLDSYDFYNQWKKLNKEIISSEPFLVESELFLRSLEKLYRRYQFNGDPKEDIQFMLETLGNRTIYPEVLGVLDDLSERYNLVIGSNSDHKPLMSDIYRSQIKVHKVYSSETLKVYKPDSLFFQKILADLGLSPHEAVYVGDSQVEDIQGPQVLGMKSIWINRKNENLLEGIPEPLLECEDLGGLLELDRFRTNRGRNQCTR